MERLSENLSACGLQELINVATGLIFRRPRGDSMARGPGGDGEDLGGIDESRRVRAPLSEGVGQAEEHDEQRHVRGGRGKSPEQEEGASDPGETHEPG